MTERDRTQSLASEAAVLVSVLLADGPTRNDDLEELKGLADTAGCRTAAKLTQRRERIDSKYLSGPGQGR